MSQENLEAFKRGFYAFNRGDTEALLRELDTEVEWRAVFQVRLGGEATVYRGQEGIRKAFREWYETLAEIQITISEIRDLGERIVAVGRIRTQDQVGGAAVEAPGGWVVEFKNGKGVRVNEYLHPTDALEAAGLEK